MGDTAEPDFAAAGLLDGLEDHERHARLNLLRRLHADGCTLEELRAAAGEERLAIVPVERMLQVRAKHSFEDAVRETGLSIEYLRANHRTIGLPRVPDDEPVYDDT